MSEAAVIQDTTAINLYGALVKAQKAAQAVAKGSKNSFHGYKYASAEAIIEEARGALSEAGLAVFVMGWRIDRGAFNSAAAAEYAKDTGTKLDKEALSQFVIPGRAVVKYRIVHESGEYLDFGETETAVIPEKGRPEDKAEATALTYNLGYFLRGLLLLPREDAALAVDARDDREKQPKAVVGVIPKRPDAVPAILQPMKIGAFEELMADLALGFGSWDEKRAWSERNKGLKNTLPLEQQLLLTAAFNDAPPKKEAK